MPLPLAALACRIGDALNAGPLRTTSLQQIEYGNTGDAAKMIVITGFTPRTMDKALAQHPASTQDRWHARLFLLRPLITLVLALLWLVSGGLGFLPSLAMASLLERFYIPAILAPFAQIVLSLLDVAIGCLIVSGRRRVAGQIQLVVVFSYTVGLTLVAPSLWLDPFGPLLKNLPILALIMVWMAIAEDA